MTEPTREQIIKACKCCQSKYADCVNCPFYCFAMNECGDCVEAIVCSTEKLLISDSARIAGLEAEVERLKEERRWIPVEDNRSGNKMLYERRIVKLKNGAVLDAIFKPYENEYMHVRWTDANFKKFHDDNPVTHWQPMPPETESEGSK